MRRCLRALLLLLMVLPLIAQPVAAHNATLVAGVAVRGHEVTIRLLDVYGSAVPGADVTVSLGVPDKRPGRATKAPETLSARYAVTVAPPAGQVYEITVAATVAGELFRAAIRAREGEDQSELLLPMDAVEQSGWLGWENVAYIAAVVVLATATAVALLRKRAVSRGEEGSK